MGSRSHEFMHLIECTLLIDDDSITNYINEALLRELRVSKNIMVFDEAELALTFMETECREAERYPELIFLDINMPAMDGFEFLKAYNQLKIKNENNTTIVLLSTSTSPQDYAEASVTQCVSEYIVKPLTEEKVMAVFNKYFRPNALV